MIFTLISSESTRVPPVTADRSPPDSRITGADSPVIADSSTDATPSTTSPSPGMNSPAGQPPPIAPRATAIPAPSSNVPSRFQSAAPRVSARDLRSVSACAFPRPSAIASAKFANSTVNHSHSVICSANPNSAEWCWTLSRTRRNGRDHRAHLHHEHHRILHQRPRIQLHHRIPHRPDHNSACPQRFLRPLRFLASVRRHFDIFRCHRHSRAHRLIPQTPFRRASANVPVSDPDSAPGKTSARPRSTPRKPAGPQTAASSPETCRPIPGVIFFASQISRDRQNRNHHEKSSEQHVETDRHVVPDRVRAQPCKRRAVICRARRVCVQNLRQPVRPGIRNRPPAIRRHHSHAP